MANMSTLHDSPELALSNAYMPDNHQPVCGTVALLGHPAGRGCELTHLWSTVAPSTGLAHGLRMH